MSLPDEGVKMGAELAAAISEFLKLVEGLLPLCAVALEFPLLLQMDWDEVLVRLLVALVLRRWRCTDSTGLSTAKSSPRVW